MKVRGTAADGVVTHPRLLADPPASPAVMQDTGNRDYYAMDIHNTSRGERSGDENLHQLTQTRSDLDTEFERRNSVLLQGCKQHDAKAVLPRMMWHSMFRHQLPGPLTMCLIFKVRCIIYLSGMLYLRYSFELLF